MTTASSPYELRAREYADAIQENQDTKRLLFIGPDEVITRLNALETDIESDLEDNCEGTVAFRDALRTCLTWLMDDWSTDGPEGDHNEGDLDRWFTACTEHAHLYLAQIKDSTCIKDGKIKWVYEDPYTYMQAAQEAWLARMTECLRQRIEDEVDAEDQFPHLLGTTQETDDE